MITEKDISRAIGRKIHSPIRMGSVSDLGIKTDTFLNVFKPFFEKLEDDVYAVKSKQITFLKEIFENEKDNIEYWHQPYFQAKENSKVLQPWIQRLTPLQKKEFSKISMITRQRNISSFHKNTSKIQKVSDHKSLYAYPKS